MNDKRPDAWQPAPRLRWKVNAVPVGTVVSYAALRPVLQQLWHIPNSEHYDWRDVPMVREGCGASLVDEEEQRMIADKRLATLQYCLWRASTLRTELLSILKQLSDGLVTL